MEIREKIFFRKRGREKKRENETANFSLQSVARGGPARGDNISSL